MPTVISVDNLSKSYRLGQIGSGTLARDLSTWWARARGKPDPLRKIGEADHGNRDGETIWALKDVTFSVEQGEVLGVIGRNGAGKSTLLKILSRVTAPTGGQVRVKGRIASLLEVGTGFHPDLTGRENVYLNGAILGMTRDEVRRKFDEIVDFAEIAQFIDTPVKRYSSGMYVRLAFAVAAHLEPEILLVDEVLAVGDAEFQKKCLGKMGDVAHEGRTVLFVSHNMAAVQNLCTRGLLLINGMVSLYGPIDSCISKYTIIKNRRDSWKSDSVGEKALEIVTASAELSGDQPDHILKVKVKLQSNRPHKPAFIAIDVCNSMGNAIMQVLPVLKPYVVTENAYHDCETLIYLPPLIPGIYSLSIWVGSHNTETLHQVDNCLTFEILDSPVKDRSFPFHSNHGFLVPKASIRYNNKALSSES